jgi:hypothetical protein
MALTKVNRGGLNTGISDSSDANAITIDSSENVLIGDASPQVTSKLTVSGNGSADTGTFMYDGTAGTYLDINTNAANGIISLEANARSGNYPPLTFITSGSERLRIQAGGGISFNGDTAAANALDDYEEGNFTVTISSGISVSSYDHQLGHYVKVGRQVTAWVFMEYNGSSRTGSHFIISGLPFNSSDDNTTESTFGGFIGYQNGFSNTNNIVHVPRGTNIIQFYEVDGSTLIGSELSGASGEIRVVVQYTVP